MLTCRVFIFWLMSRVVPAALMAAALAGCATSNPEYLKRIELQKGVRADAKPCCPSLEPLLAQAQPLALARTRLDPESPHLDIGFGLAPLAVYRLDAKTDFVEAEAPLQLLGWAYGGDGRARHLDVKVRFLDETKQVVVHGDVAREVRYIGGGYRALFYTAKAPANARYVVFTTDPKVNGESLSTPLRNMPGMFAMAGAVPIYLPGGSTASFWLTSYSPVAFRAFDVSRVLITTP
jgi:hypothetical protein